MGSCALVVVVPGVMSVQGSAGLNESIRVVTSSGQLTSRRRNKQNNDDILGHGG